MIAKLNILALFFFFHLDANLIAIHGEKYILELYDTDNQLVRSYPIGIGSHGMGKTKSGDRKTPIGEYKIVWMASRFANEDGGHLISNEKAFATLDNQFTDDPSLADPDEKLWEEAYGGSEAVVMGLNYPSDSDLAKGYTGCCIEIHATHLGGIGKSCSAGCIRMRPSDARDLYKQVEIGTSVIIY